MLRVGRHFSSSSRTHSWMDSKKRTALAAGADGMQFSKSETHIVSFFFFPRCKAPRFQLKAKAAPGKRSLPGRTREAGTSRVSSGYGAGYPPGISGYPPGILRVQ